MLKSTLAGLIFLGASTLSYGQETYTIRFPHSQPEDSTKGMAAIKFKELVEKYSEGKVKVEIFSNNSLMNDCQSAGGLLDDKIEMVAPSTSQMDIFYKNKNENLWALFDIPYFIKDFEDVQKIKTFFPDFNKFSATNNLLLVDLWPQGSRGLTTNIKIETPEDLSKLKPRSQPSFVIRKMYMNWGAYPRMSDYNTLYTLMSYGVVDSSDNPAANVFNSSLHHVQRYFYKTNHVYANYVVGIRKNFWEKLPADIKAHVTKALDETNKYSLTLAEIDDKTALEKLEMTGLIRITEPKKEIVNFIKSKNDTIINELSPQQVELYNKIIKTK